MYVDSVFCHSFVVSPHLGESPRLYPDFSSWKFLLDTSLYLSLSSPLNIHGIHHVGYRVNCNR